MKKIMELDDVRELVIRNECFMHMDYLGKAPEWAIPKWESKNPKKEETTTIKLPDGVSLKLVKEKINCFFNTPNILNKKGILTKQYYEIYQKGEKIGYAIPGDDENPVIEGIFFF